MIPRITNNETLFEAYDFNCGTELTNKIIAIIEITNAIMLPIKVIAVDILAIELGSMYAIRVFIILFLLL
ncbi:hypothetical protein [Methanosphaera sp. BMS]|uniref:hypothetical protein n=1 Tax=Methanosphaera sp. BMS TaxID=1789762 RepID=UPI0013A6F8DF|nr:hypothetical protein [Methanosphaera sp. BMS]